MTKIAIVYHSGYGHTQKLAEAVLRGVQSVEGSEARLLAVDEVEANWEVLDAAEAIIFGSPTYMGGASAQFKAFADSTSGHWMAQAWRDKIAAGFTNSASPSGDKLSTLQYFSILAAQQGMVWVGQSELPAGKDGGNIEDVNRLGSSLGAMSQSPQGQHDENSPLPGDLKTGEVFGVRVATATKRWVAGANR